MRILSVASEFAPLAKTGGLADVGAALPRALVAAGHEVVAALPLYRQSVLDRVAIEAVPELNDLDVRLGSRSVRFAVRRGQLAGGGPVLWLVDAPEMFHRNAIYSSDPDETLRFALLCHASLIACHRLNFWPDVVHAHDWQAALLPLLLRTSYAWEPQLERARTVLTIHNLEYQGRAPAELASSLGLPARAIGLLHQDELRAGRVNLLLTGIQYADAITTVSPRYSEEIQTPQYGAGLDRALIARRGALLGILNGVDADWNPATDRLIPERYDADTLERKSVNRRVLLEKTGLDPADRSAPVLGLVSRLASQKGIELLFEPLQQLFDQTDARLVVLGSGEARYEQFCSELQWQHRGKICFYKGFNNSLAHLIEAGADLFLMPSRFEPCGLNQMYSQLYGTVPLVRRVGGLADTVTEWDPATGQGTGFLFEAYDSEALWRALTRALRVYDDSSAWRRIQLNGMRQNFSWKRSAEQYLALYQQLVGRSAA
jgi:starch synthase